MNNFIVFGFGIVQLPDNLHKIRINNAKIFVEDEVMELPMYVLPCDRDKALQVVNGLFDQLEKDNATI